VKSGVGSMKRFISGLLTGIALALLFCVFTAGIIAQAFFNDAIKIVVDGKQLDVSPVTVILKGEVNGTSYVAARAVAEALGARVDWDGTNKRMIITSQASNQLHKVVRIIDGDTFEIEGGQKVRMIGIDTPESVHPDKLKNTEFGEAASNYTKKLLEGKNVSLVKDVSETDKYGRLLRYVYLEDGTFVNELLVREGYAKVATYPPDVKYAEVFIAAERYARENSKGLWAYDGTEPVQGNAGEYVQETIGKYVKEAAEEPGQGNMEEYMYVASVNSNMYHLPACRYAKDILEKNLLKFKNRADAESNGYEPCNVCKP